LAIGAPSQIPLDNGTTAFLSSIDEVPLYVMPCNVEAAQTISTTNVWPGGSSGLALNGTNRTVFLWDDGEPRLSHSEFTSRVFALSGNSNITSHSTGVAATMIAAGANNISSNGINIGPAAKGMSFAGRAQAGQFLFDLAQMPGQVGTNSMRLSNHSYEHSTGWVYAGSGAWYWFGNSEISTNQDPKFGNYSAYAVALDQIAQNAPTYLGVWAAGNDVSNAPPVQPTNHTEFSLATGAPYSTNRVHPANGNAGGYESISDYGCAKNTLTVGAVFPLGGGYAGPTNVIWAPFSSCGPTDDGRIKPDVVAAGIAIITADMGNDYAYQAASGTSFAAPSVTGSINLLAQHYRLLHANSADLLSSTLKALIIQTADQPSTNTGPGYRFGWGLMNTASAARLVANDATNSAKNFLKEVMLNNGQFIKFPVVSAGGTNNPLKITVAWTDPAGASSALTNLDNPAVKLVNDLDLRVISPTGTTNFPWLLNPDLTNRTSANRSAAATTGDDNRNNVEQIYVANPSSGTYTVSVTHKGTLTNSQWVSILISGNVAQQPPAFAITQILQTATNQMAVGWPTVVGQRYQIQTITPLAASNSWQNIGPQISARLTNVVAQVQMTATNSQAFYRVIQVQ
jgi:Subtilase family